MSNIVLHVALEDSVEGSQQSNEAISVDSCNLNVGLGNDIGSTGLTL